MTRPTFLSLFSGIEGLGLGLERAGWRCVGQVEIDKACRENVLARHYPTVPRWADIRSVHGPADCPDRIRLAGEQRRQRRIVPRQIAVVGGEEARRNGGTLHDESAGHRQPPTGGFCPDCLPAADLVCGGFPCQDISVAGRRQGLAGARSGLWWEFHRILAGLRPRWVVIENVPGLLSSNNGRDMGAIVGSLGDLGYLGASRVLDAQHFGLAQRRRRVFIVGCLGDRAAPATVLLEPESGPGDPAPRRTAGARVAASLTAGVAAARGVNAPGRRAEDDVNLVTHTLTTRTAVEEDGTGRGVPITVGTLQGGGQRGRRIDAEGAASGHLLAFSSSGAGWYREGLGTLTEGGFRDSRDGLVTHALTAEGADASEGGTGGGTPLVVTPIRAAGAVGANGLGIGRAGGPAPTLDTTGDAAIAGAAVRRLTPTECERLQGFPDGWTAGQADSVRYRQLGNAVAVPVTEWIGRRILNAWQATA